MTKAPTRPQSPSSRQVPPPRRTVDVLGVPIDFVTLEEANARMLALVGTEGAPHLVLTPNTDHLLRARRDPSFLALCREGSLVIADGQPVVWASALLGKRLPCRVAGSDLMPLSVVAAARQGLRYFFLGGNPGDAEAAARILAERAGRDGLCGVDCPPLGFEKDPQYLDGLVKAIHAAAPDIVYVGLGSPKQELLMRELRRRLSTSVLMAVGITFSFVAGTVKRAPRWMQRCGLEWAWRLCREPRRLWRRYLDNLVFFPWHVLRARLFRS